MIRTMREQSLSEYRRSRRRLPCHGKPAGVLIGFEFEEDWFDYRLEHDPRFLAE